MNNFIAIEGNIGAGKTTLCQKLAAEWDARLILEQFDDNPFLPFFYENKERYAFSVELFFMTERHKQLQESLSQIDIFRSVTISDYFFIKTLLFAKNNLSHEEYRLFQRLFQILNTTFPKPDLLVYLHRPIEALLQNIHARGRAYEKDITPDYLLKIQQAYFNYFKNLAQQPILLIDASNADFDQPETLENIKILLQKKYDNGIHRVTL